MRRKLVDGVLDRRSCSEFCELLDRCARELPREAYARTLLGLGQDHAYERDGSMTLADVVRVDGLRRLLARKMRAFAPPPEGARLVLDGTLFKRGHREHRKDPHVDSEGDFAHRKLTAVLYFNDCTSGSIVFGHLGPDGFVPEETILPVAGRLALFDDAPSNAHAVNALEDGYRYNVQAWFRFAGPDDTGPAAEHDWTSLYLYARWERLRLRLGVCDVQVETAERGSSVVRGVSDAGPFCVELETEHLALFDRLAGKSELVVRELVDHANPLDATVQLLALLARVNALSELAPAP